MANYREVEVVSNPHYRVLWGYQNPCENFSRILKPPIEQLDSYFKTIPIILTEHSGPLPVSRNKDYIRTQKKKHNIKKINK